MMKRRNFLTTLSLGTPAALTSTPLFSEDKKETLLHRQYEYFYPEVSSLEDVKTKEGQVMLRFAIYSKNKEELAEITGHIKVKKGRLARSKNYFFEPQEDEFDDAGTFSMHTSLNYCDVLVLWLEEVSDATIIELKTSNDNLPSFTLKEVLDAKTLKLENEVGKAEIHANFLLDKEIGEIDPKEVGIKTPEGDFSFVVMADTQGGDPTAPKVDDYARMKIHNAFIEESVRVVNELEGTPLFSIVVGDIVDSKGQWENFTVMSEYLKKVNMPLLFTVGNHETAYNIKLTPGYNMEGFTNFFNAQKEVNGMDKLLYSFNLGAWHFVVWPDPLRNNFWETHPHYFDWLDKDLEKYKDKPVMFFHHVPLMPIGIDPLINYVESVSVKRKVLDLLSKHGNVQYALSGHVHIPLKASVKTAVNYKGIRFINLPATGYRPRAFGEEDYYGDPVQGVAIVNVSGEKLSIDYKNITNLVYRYPENFREFEKEKYPLWLSHKWELPSTNTLQNGDFRQGLKHWHKRFVYMEDERPSNICEVRQFAKKGSASSLYLASRKRGFDIPGQDRLPQTINRICTAVNIIPGKNYELTLNMLLDGAYTAPNSFSAAYIWIEGFEGAYKRLNLVYSAGKMYRMIGGNYEDARTVYPTHLDLPIEMDKWENLQLNIAGDFNAHSENKKFNQLKLDRLIINLGTWSVNDSGHSTKVSGDNRVQAAAYFDGLQFQPTDAIQRSNLGKQQLLPKNEKDLWSKRIGHIGGEHIY